MANQERSGQGRKYGPGTASRSLTFNDPHKAREYFAIKEKFILGPQELRLIMREQPELIQIIDVRETVDYARGHIPEAVNLPEDHWKLGHALKKNKINVIYGYSLECPLAAKAAAELAARGYSVMEMVGGFKSWQEMEFDIELKVHH